MPSSYVEHPGFTSTAHNDYH